MRLLVLVAVLAMTSVTSAAQSKITGTLTLNTSTPVAGGVAEFIATIEGIVLGNDIKTAQVGNVDLQCYQNGALILDVPSPFTLFYNTSEAGPYTIDFNLTFSGAANCEAHLFTSGIGPHYKAAKRTNGNTITTVAFVVQP